MNKMAIKAKKKKKDKKSLYITTSPKHFDQFQSNFTRILLTQTAQVFGKVTLYLNSQNSSAPLNKMAPRTKIGKKSLYINPS